MSSITRYTSVIQPPPGQEVAPNGFPADPRPKNAPKVFLDAMGIRIAVFCDEQKCAIEPELDEDDPKSWSWVMYQQNFPDDRVIATHEHELTTSQDKPVATLRMVPPPHLPHPNGFHDEQEEPYVKLTRVATVQDARGLGLNKKLLLEALEWMRDPENGQNMAGEEWNGLVLTHAQVAVEGMYQKLGFVTDERLGKWDEEGIEHVGMWLKLKMKS